MQHARRNIDRSIRRSVIDVSLRCTTRIYSNSLHDERIAPSASYVCQHWTRGGDTNHAVAKRYAVDVFMHPFMITMVTRFKKKAPFAEL